MEEHLGTLQVNLHLTSTMEIVYRLLLNIRRGKCKTYYIFMLMILFNDYQITLKFQLE